MDTNQFGIIDKLVKLRMKNEKEYREYMKHYKIVSKAIFSVLLDSVEKLGKIESRKKKRR